MRSLFSRSALRATNALTVLLFLLGSAGAVSAQEATDPRLSRAIDAYLAGDLVRADAVLDSVPADVSRADRATAALYRGLVAFSRNDRTSAQRAFARALDEQPSLRLDPSVHSPARVALFDEVRTARVAEWRREAATAEAEGDRTEALARWSAVLGAEPGDDQAREAIGRLAGGDAPPANRRAEPERRPPTDRPAAPVPERTNTETRSASVAALLGIALPGAGEVYAGRPARGALVIGGVAGALAAGFLLTRIEVDCRSVPQDGVCPEEDVLGETETQPYKTVGIAAAAAIALAGAIDAALGVRSETAGLSSRIDTNADGGVAVTLLRLRR